MILTELITIFVSVIHLQRWNQLWLKRIVPEIEREFSQVIVGIGRRLPEIIQIIMTSKFGDYSISWNLDGGDAFAISEESIHEAGCIHTSQGLEFDYVGVIIGDDMQFENGKVITDYTKRARTDNSLKGIKTLAKKDKAKS